MSSASSSALFIINSNTSSLVITSQIPSHARTRNLSQICNEFEEEDETVNLFCLCTAKTSGKAVTGWFFGIKNPGARSVNEDFDCGEDLDGCGVNE